MLYEIKGHLSQSYIDCHRGVDKPSSELKCLLRTFPLDLSLFHLSHPAKGMSKYPSCPPEELSYKNMKVLEPIIPRFEEW